MNKKCPKCCAEFECLHNLDCWCSKYVLSEKLSLYLRSNYVDCLCENCLKYYIENAEIILLNNEK